jgi:hypothetical protein
MSGNKVLKVLNPILAVLLLNQAATGFLADSLPHETFEVLHEGGGVALVVVALVHLLLNGRWIVSSYFTAHRLSTGK